jgi:hypothetical protein
MKASILTLILFITATVACAQYTTASMSGQTVMFRQSYYDLYDAHSPKAGETKKLSYGDAETFNDAQAVQTCTGTMDPWSMIMRVLFNINTFKFKFLNKATPNLFLSTDGALVVSYDTTLDAWKIWHVTGKYYAPDGCRIFK